MDAFKDPSAEHMQIYIGIGLAVIIIAGLVYSALGSNEKTTALTLDDMGPSENEGKKKKKDTGSSSKSASSKKVAEKEDEWEDEDFDRDALHQEIDKVGFTKSLSGTLDPPQVLKLRDIIGRHAYTMFMPIKKDLLEKRIALMKADRKQEYMQAIGKANTEYARCNMEVSKAAAEWLDMDQNSFGMSMRDAMNDPEIAK